MPELSRFPARAALGVLLLAASDATALIQPPDHIVIVVEENHSFAQVIGSPEAPYINSLAATGALLVDALGLQHPSQPNYLHFFSGSNQGMYDNTLPPGRPFTTPNLAAALLGQGYTFVGYSDGLPNVGFDGETFDAYRRKHNPWANWQSLTPGPNQFTPDLNRPFTDFPADFDSLPTVCIVVPDQNHDMHDGTIAEADAWLEANLGAYAAWCSANNSLLIVTWDEDNSAAGNHIPTILHGPMVRTGQLDARCTLHSLLRTIEDLYGLPHSGAAESVRPLIGVFVDDPIVRTRSFQQGASGYSGAIDTHIELAAPTAGHPSDVKLVSDGSPMTQSLVRMEQFVGPAADLVPAGATITSATLSFWTGEVSSDGSRDWMGLHRMLIDWDSSATWASLVNGVSADGIEAEAVADSARIASTADTWAAFDVTATVQAWVNNPASNLGWVVLPSGSDGWRCFSSDSPDVSRRPLLSVTFVAPTCRADLNGDGAVTSADFFAFLVAFFSGDAAADFDADLVVTSNDFFLFLVEFFAGC